MASAKASRMLLEAPDVRGAIPEVLRLMGEAAHVDRVNVMLARRGPEGEPLLVGGERVDRRRRAAAHR